MHYTLYKTAQGLEVKSKMLAGDNKYITPHYTRYTLYNTIQGLRVNCWPNSKMLGEDNPTANSYQPSLHFLYSALLS